MKAKEIKSGNYDKLDKDHVSPF